MSLDVRPPAASGADPEERLPTLDLAPGWAIAQLAALTDVSLGKTPGKADYDDNGALKIVKYRDLDDDGRIDWDNSIKGFVKPDRVAALHLRPLLSGDVLVSASAHSSEIIGRKVLLVTRVPDRFEQVFVCGEILCIRCERSHVDPLPSFLRYFLQSAKGYKSIQAKVHGVHLIASRAEEISVPVAPVSEQQRICSKIDELFSRIDEGEAALARVAKLVERYRQSVLKAAVTGELTRDWRAARKRAGEPVESGEALLARILKARRAAWEAAELAKLKAKGKSSADDRWKQKYKEPAPPNTTDLPALPEGWVWTTIEQLCFVETGSTPKRGNARFYEGGTIDWITSAAVNAQLIVSAEERITEAAIEETNTKVFAAGSLIVAMYGEGKTRGKVSELGIPAATNQACAALLCGHLDAGVKAYTKVFLEKNYVALRSAAAGGVQPNLNLSIIKMLPVALPSLPEQAVILSHVYKAASSAEIATQGCTNEMRRVVALRQSILKAAFSGQLVPQDPSDEPASRLLERIAAERAATATQRKHRGTPRAV